jgi:hypothetical protein
LQVTAGLKEVRDRIASVKVRTASISFLGTSALMLSAQQRLQHHQGHSSSSSIQHISSAPESALVSAS